MRLALMAACLLSGAVAPLYAQEPNAMTMEMPTREVFVDEQCVPAMRRTIVMADASSQRAVETAACECSYRLLAPHEEVTRKMFDAASLLCRMEFEAGPEAFVGKYGAPAPE